MNAVLESGRPLESLASIFHRFPQILLNVRAQTPERWQDDPEILAALADVERRLAGRGRVLVRASGTEPLVRVMTECDDAAEASDTASSLADLVARRLGGTVVRAAAARGGVPPSGSEIAPPGRE